MSRLGTEPQLQSFPEMAFRKTWRGYQERLLSQLDGFIADRRLHIVAAPGSGKTVLGLEVVRRIGQRTLVLTPTLTIRDQWVDRLVSHFLADGAAQPEWVSVDIRAPKALTVVTYQALHSICSGVPAEGCEPATNDQEDVDQAKAAEPADDEAPNHRQPEIPGVLQDAGFSTLVVDEAHHLRSEWWRTLMLFAERLEKPIVIALTATPPYDVSPYEWQRYEQLCGPVDAEVSIPELVFQGDLCPHQDYAYLSVPSPNERQTLSDFRIAVGRLNARLLADETFQLEIERHHWVTGTDLHIEEILEDPEYASSIVVFLHAAGRDVPAAALNVLGLTKKRIPPLTLDWLEILLSRCLYSDTESFKGGAELFKALRRELIALGAVEHHRVKLRSPSEHLKLLTGSITKLKSIEEIVKLEAAALRQELRCVVLTDYIRKDEMPDDRGSTGGFEEIGIVPIFETLRCADLSGVALGVLSGSLVIVPVGIEPILRESAAQLGIRQNDLELVPLAHDKRYAAVELSGACRQGSVRLLTNVFEKGAIHVLVGTKSLLGEGWDAPCINTLVLASFVGSYVLSNQMRGRSIRIDSARPGKTANIWHLACVEPGLAGPGDDYEILVRRCAAFSGVNPASHTIESGADRLGLGHPPFSQDEIAAINSQACSRALNRERLRSEWKQALNAGQNKEMVEGLKAPESALPRGFVLSNTIAALLAQGSFVFGLIFSELMRRPYRGHSSDDFFSYIELVIALSAAISLPWFVGAVWRFVRHGTPERSIEQIGRAIIDGLRYEGSLGRAKSDLKAAANGNRDGTVFCSAMGGAGLEQATFLRGLREVLGPVENPRYLLTRPRLWRLFREDYFPVPAILGRKKEYAEFFAKRWGRLVGPVELVYTRTPEGRRTLLKARVHSLAASFQKRTERVSCWK